MTQSTLSPADSQSAVVSPLKSLFQNPELLDPTAVEVGYHLACITEVLTKHADGQFVNDLLRCAGQLIDLLRRPEAL